MRRRERRCLHILILLEIPNKTSRRCRKSRYCWTRRQSYAAACLSLTLYHGDWYNSMRSSIFLVPACIRSLRAILTIASRQLLVFTSPVLGPVASRARRRPSANCSHRLIELPRHLPLVPTVDTVERLRHLASLASMRWPTLFRRMNSLGATELRTLVLSVAIFVQLLVTHSTSPFPDVDT